MTTGVGTYSTTAASNTALFPEGQTPSSLNDGMRQVEADIATWFQTAEWLDFAHTPTYVSTTSFTVATDQTTKYVQHRRIRCTDATTLYGTITSSSYSAPNTTVNVTLDSGSLSASLTLVALSLHTPTSTSIPSTIGRTGATIASATTTDIGAATGDFIDISGTTTITGLGTIASGVMRTVRFTGALILTHNATSLILPGSANITTANGDTAIFRSLGSGNWKCIAYTKADGTAVVVAGYVFSPVTDSTAIVKGSSDATKLLRFEVDGFTTGTTRVVTFPNYDLSLFVSQRVGNKTGASATGSTTMPIDNTIPQNTEGDQYLSQAITPSNASTILVIDVIAIISNPSAAGTWGIALFQDTTANALSASLQRFYSSTNPTILVLRHVMTSGTASATTFKVRIGSDAAGTNQFNGISGTGQIFNGVMCSSIYITEYSA